MPESQIDCFYNVGPEGKQKKISVDKAMSCALIHL